MKRANGSRVVKATAEKSKQPDIFRCGCLFDCARTNNESRVDKEDLKRFNCQSFQIFFPFINNTGLNKSLVKPKLQNENFYKTWTKSFESKSCPFRNELPISHAGSRRRLMTVTCSFN